MQNKLVAVITRTKDRPILLERALQSVTGQTHRDLVWVVVNDGGKPEPVDAVAQRARAQGLETVLLHNPSSCGMAVASNQGIKSVQSKYVVIHDDDDSWEPQFLEQTVGYLESLPVDHATRGVVAAVTVVEEVIKADVIVVTQRSPYAPEPWEISLFQMASVNHVPPPICFLFRRDVFDVIGYYRGDLGVTGDWEFNLRFLQQFDIGLIPNRLANYHLRIGTQPGLYSNSQTVARSLHSTTQLMLRNELLRADLRANRVGLGFIVNACHDLEFMRSQLLQAGNDQYSQIVSLRSETRALAAEVTSLRRPWLFRILSRWRRALRPSQSSPTGQPD